jgi:hypothetical protein
VRWEAARRERRFRRGLVIGITSAVLLSVAAVAVIGFVVVPVLSRQTNDVAAAVSEQVGGQVVADARQQRQDTGRKELAKANGRLAARQLPIVPDPGPTASGDALLIQAARANVLADLPDPIVADLRRELAGKRTLPSSLTDEAAPLGDVVVGVLPLAPGGPTIVEGPRTATPPRPGTGGSSRAPVPAPPGTNPTVPSAPPAPPAPAPPAPPRGLLPLLPNLPIRIPLLSS